MPAGIDDASLSCRGRLLSAMRAALIALVLLLAGAGPASAQAAAPEGGAAEGAAVSVQDLESLVSAIEDEARRKELIAQLKALIAAQRAQEGEAEQQPGMAGALAALAERVRTASADVVETVTLVLDVPALWRWLEDAAADPDRRRDLLIALAQLVAALGAGALGGWLTTQALSRPRRALDARTTGSLLVKVALVVAVTVLDVLPIVVFGAAAYGVLPLLDPDASVRLIAIALINASVLARLVTVAARAVLAPSSESHRLAPLGSETAAYVFVWIRRFVLLSIYGYFLLEAAALLGLPPPLYGLFRNAVGLLFAVLLVVFVLQVRHGVAGWLRGAPADEPLGGLRLVRARLADIWHILAIGYVVAGYVIWALRIYGGSALVLRGTLLTLMVLALARLAIMGVRRLVAWLFAIGADLRGRYPFLQERANLYLPAVQAVLRWIVYAFAALAILQAWGVDSFGWLATESGRAVIGRLVAIVLVVVIALIAWEMISAVIERRLAAAESGTGRGLSGARLRTLLPFARRAIMIALVVMVGLVVLAEIGVDTAPLLAGAGVVGLAIGFGAQSLVKDVITGLFILIEDSVAVGDIAEVAGHAGVVEAMSIRSIRLRDYDGHVHTVPFSEVTTVRNMTKEFSFAVFDVGVAYRENVDEVIRVIVEVAEGMRADPDFAPYILEPLEVAGLDQFGDSAVVIRARFKVLPAQQWRTRREFNRRLKIEFDRRGIEIPFPQRSVWFGVDKSGGAPAMRVALEDEAGGETPRVEDRAARGDGGAGPRPAGGGRS